MELSVTTGRRGLRSRSKPTRSPIAELTRRASRTTDLDKGRWTLCSIDPFLARVCERDSAAGFWGLLYCDKQTPKCAECRVPNLVRLGEFEGAGEAPSFGVSRRGSLRGAAPRWRCRQRHGQGRISRLIRTRSEDGGRAEEGARGLAPGRAGVGAMARTARPPDAQPLAAEFPNAVA